MIKASDLRIGNIVHAEDDFLFMSCDVKIISISEKEVEWESISEGNTGTKQKDNIIDLEEIPLTPEILKACNIKGLNGRFHINNSYHLWQNYDDTFTIYLVAKGEFHFICHLKYLHELQNCYYIINKGEELTLSLKETIKG